MNTNYHRFDELLFCDIQIEHYRELFRRHRNGWNFRAAAFAWKRMKYYQRLRIDLVEVDKQLTYLITD